VKTPISDVRCWNRDFLRASTSQEKTVCPQSQNFEFELEVRIVLPHKSSACQERNSETSISILATEAPKHLAHIRMKNKVLLVFRWIVFHILYVTDVWTSKYS
jgi:hypothetical protein